jgi:hypothetical protein
MGSELARLRAFLTGIPSRDINPGHERELETLLGSCWEDLAIADTGGMNPQKLFSRMENITWHHPTLQFEIERHGAVAQGSVNARMQPWSINVETGEASFDPYGRLRLVGKKNSPPRFEPDCGRNLRIGGCKKSTPVTQVERGH